jgi:hypothetical protein
VQGTIQVDVAFVVVLVQFVLLVLLVVDELIGEAVFLVRV